MTMVKLAKKHMFFCNFKPVFEGLDKAKTENYFKMFKIQIPHTQIAIISTWRNTVNKTHETLHGNFVVWVWPLYFPFSHSFFLPVFLTISGIIVFLMSLFCIFTSLWSGFVGLFFLVLMPGLWIKKALSRTKKS